MARNDMPEETCIECGRPATHLCLSCMHDLENAVLCDEHAEEHMGEDMGDPIELVNSPRLGLCGYCGPADPWYRQPHEDEPRELTFVDEDTLWRDF